jgi:hypothetical protein
MLADELCEARASLSQNQSVGTRFFGDVDHDWSLSQRFGARGLQSCPDFIIFCEPRRPIFFLLA